MPSRRKFRRNKRKTRRRGKRGGGNCGTQGENNCNLCLGGKSSYDEAKNFVRDNGTLQLDINKIADYYWNKALTQFRGTDKFGNGVFNVDLNYTIDAKNPDGLLSAKDESAKNPDELLSAKDESVTNSLHIGPNKDRKLGKTFVGLRAKAASKHLKGKKMEAIFLSIMKDFVTKYNSSSETSLKIESVGSLSNTGGNEWSTFKIENFATNNNGYQTEANVKGWEAQNCFLTAGDTRKFSPIEKFKMKKGEDGHGMKQAAAGYIIGKILGEIGHQVGADLAEKLGIKNGGYGLESMSGLRISAILLYLCAKDKSDWGPEEDKDLKNFLGIKMLEIQSTSEKPLTISEIDKARGTFKQMIRDAASSPIYKLNPKNIQTILKKCDDEGGGVTNITFKATQTTTGGRKRRRRKRRTRRGGKSRRKRRKTRRRRRRR